MTKARRSSERLSGWAISLFIHLGLAAVAGISAFGGYVGRSAEGSAGPQMRWNAYRASVRESDAEPVTGLPIPDPVQYGRLNSSETPLETISEPLLRIDAPLPRDEPAPLPAASVAEEPSFRPASAPGRNQKLTPR